MDSYQSNVPKPISAEKLQHAFAILSLELSAIIKRNEEKDRGKEFEGSYTRVIFIMVVTYGTLLGYMSLIGTKQAYLNAIVPTLGFNISTWSLPYVKNIWIRWQERRKQVEMEGPVRQHSNATHSAEVDVETGDTL